MESVPREAKFTSILNYQIAGRMLVKYCSLKYLLCSPLIISQHITHTLLKTEDKDIIIHPFHLIFV